MSVLTPVDMQLRTLMDKINLFLEMPQADFCRKLTCIVPPLAADSNLMFHEQGPNLIFLLAGTQRTVYADKEGRKEYIQQPGELLYFDRGIHYTTFWDTYCLRLGITVHQEGFFISWNENPGQGMYVKVPDIHYGVNHVDRSDYPDLFAALGARAKQFELADEVSCSLPRLLLHVVMEMLRGESNRHPAGDPLFTRIAGYIGKNYMHRLNGKILAEKFGVSEGHLSRISTRCSGMGIGGYICGVRMEQAYLMLHDRRFSVEQTAEYCGFADTSYFVKVFRRYWGILPGELRRHREGVSSATPVIDHYKLSGLDK